MTSKEYFYLGFYPEGLRNYEGPKYIGVFKLLHKQRFFDTVIIIENPYYIDDPSHLINFKYIVAHMTDALLTSFFKFSGLKRPDQTRYYLVWMHM